MQSYITTSDIQIMIFQEDTSVKIIANDMIVLQSIEFLTTFIITFTSYRYVNPWEIFLIVNSQK